MKQNWPVETETTVPAEAYARFGSGKLTAYDGWLERELEPPL
jgi:hypothetical protein